MTRSSNRRSNALELMAFGAVVVGLTACSVAGVTITQTGSVASPGSVSAVVTPTTSPSPAVGAVVGRYPDGLPRVIDGQAVLRGADAIAAARSATTSESFLVGTWLDVYTGPRSCPIDTTSHPPDSWLHGCPPTIFASDEAGSRSSVLSLPAATFRFAAGLTSGPAVLAVHVHDARAAACGTDLPACEAMMVIDRAVWAGDAATAPRPLSVDDVLAALRRVDPSATYHLLGDGDMRTEGGLTNAQTLSPGDVAPADKQVTGAYILPSADAVHRALPGVGDGVAGSVLPAAFAWGSSGQDATGREFSVTARWLVIDNVVLSVALTDATPTPTDRALMETLVHALDPSQ